MGHARRRRGQGLTQAAAAVLDRGAHQVHEVGLHVRLVLGAIVVLLAHRRRVVRQVRLAVVAVVLVRCREAEPLQLAADTRPERVASAS